MTMTFIERIRDLLLIATKQKQANMSKMSFQSFYQATPDVYCGDQSLKNESQIYSFIS